jgi:hypothetical protein
MHDNDNWDVNNWDPDITGSPAASRASGPRRGPCG